MFCFLFQHWPFSDLLFLRAGTCTFLPAATRKQRNQPTHTTGEERLWERGPGAAAAEAGREREEEDEQQEPIRGGQSQWRLLT